MPSTTQRLCSSMPPSEATKEQLIYLWSCCVDMVDHPLPEGLATNLIDTPWVDKMAPNAEYTGLSPVVEPSH